jgi:hypothetical protein
LCRYLAEWSFASMDDLQAGAPTLKVFSACQIPFVLIGLVACGDAHGQHCGSNSIYSERVNRAVGGGI